MAEKPISVVPLLSRALHRIRSTPPRIIASPPTQPRRAAVSLIIRVVPAPNAVFPPESANPVTLSEFFELDWVNDPAARPEILFLQRENPAPEDSAMSRMRNTQEAHVAFPGGRMEADDEGGLYTAMRQTWEEIGIDLAEKDYTCIGQLDDREITTSLGKRLLMILSPFVFLQLTPNAPPPDPAVSTTLHWTSLASLVSAHAPPRWSTVAVDAASRLAPKHSTALRLIVQALVGSMEFPAIIVHPSSLPSITLDGKPNIDILEKGILQAAIPHKLKLWGLSLGMTLDLMSYMVLPEPSSLRDNSESLKPHSGSSSPISPMVQLPYQTGAEGIRMDVVAPSLASVFPRFSYPDVNFWIWVFGKRYREVVRGWEASVRGGGTNDRRINWSGSALSTFYAAVRKALVVVIVARALGILFGVAFATWWIFGQ
ncbi:Nudix hydrolase domain-containing protein [Mycena sanguinolenta]|uniref:Nudix hydrolase domain-containing protein n=1 Tax=Mycena sanguinolenta TaxID=230812 RepID=A0A8H7DBY4_9AGAR|nr:Nudix hydrolase domain-containing protein [Mycena sanguinolenta]